LYDKKHRDLFYKHITLESSVDNSEVLMQTSRDFSTNSAASICNPCHTN